MPVYILKEIGIIFKFFIDEAHKRELKVTVSTTIFTAGLPSSKNGMAYRDDTWNGKTCLEYTKDQGLIDIKNDKTKVSAFFESCFTGSTRLLFEFHERISYKLRF